MDTIVIVKIVRQIKSNIDLYNFKEDFKNFCVLRYPNCSKKKLTV